VDPALPRGQALLAARDLLRELIDLDLAIVGAAGHASTLAHR
jgi:hypothetical protein